MTTYKSAGVHVAAGTEFVRRIKERVPVIGGFSGLFSIPLKRWKEPVLVASTDGVGTKLLVAEMMKKHDTVGIDLVAMVVNDIAVCGAKPLFFLDYFAMKKLRLSHAEEILEGILEGCRQAKCLLLGGETAELPGMYEGRVYDLAGFGVGIVEKKKVIDGSTIRCGDLVIGVASNGLHSNGYSLARRALLQKAKLSLRKKHPSLEDKLGDVLLRPTIIYSPLIEALTKRLRIKGMAHITGGGIPGNLCRILPPRINAMINSETWPRPPIFDLIQETGSVPWDDMFNTFNMGIGLILTVDPKEEKDTHRICRRFHLDSFVIGEAIPGNGSVCLK